MTFKELKSILEGFKNIADERAKTIHKKIMQNTYGIGNLENPIDFYKNGLL